MTAAPSPEPGPILSQRDSPATSGTSLGNIRPSVLGCLFPLSANRPSHLGHRVCNGNTVPVTDPRVPRATTWQGARPLWCRRLRGRCGQRVSVSALGFHCRWPCRWMSCCSASALPSRNAVTSSSSSARWSKSPEAWGVGPPGLVRIVSAARWAAAWSSSTCSAALSCSLLVIVGALPSWLVRLGQPSSKYRQTISLFSLVTCEAPSTRYLGEPNVQSARPTRRQCARMGLCQHGVTLARS
jgi:hypothetical protein